MTQKDVKVIKDEVKKSKNDPPINLKITPEDMDEVAKGQYEFCDQFCDQIEQRGLGAMLGINGVKELREYNDKKMREYDPEYLKKKEEMRAKTVSSPVTQNTEGFSISMEELPEGSGNEESFMGAAFSGLSGGSSQKKDPSPETPPKTRRRFEL